MSPLSPRVGPPCYSSSVVTRSTNNRSVFARPNHRDLLFSGLMEVERFTIQLRDRSGMTTLSFPDLDPGDTREALAHLGCADGL